MALVLFKLNLEQWSVALTSPLSPLRHASGNLGPWIASGRCLRRRYQKVRGAFVLWKLLTQVWTRTNHSLTKRKCRNVGYISKKFHYPTTFIKENWPNNDTR